MVQNADNEPRGLSGKWVVAGVFAVALLAVLVAALLVRPDPGSDPAEVHDRPFGPATPAEQRADETSTPLIYRSGDGQ